MTKDLDQQVRDFRASLVRLAIAFFRFIWFAGLYRLGRWIVLFIREFFANLTNRNRSPRTT